MSKGYKKYIPLKEKQIIESPESYVVVDKDGVVHEEVRGIIIPSKKYDSRDFCKIFKPGILMLSTLSTPAIKVLLYLLYTLKYASEIEFDISECMEFTKYKNKTYIYKALSELKSSNVVLKIKNGHYELDPTLFYKGSVMKEINKNKKK